MPQRLLPILIVLAVLLGTLAPSWAARRAVLVGINDYGEQRNEGGRWRDLRGATNDAEAMRAVLVSRFGFERDDVVMLLDGDATRGGILDAIERELIAPAAPGDTAFFYFAGHGSQVRNEAGAEADRLDETIVPADSARGAADIRDKELRVLFNRVIDGGSDLVAIFDSCSSGSILRSVETGRFLPPSNAVAKPLPVDDRAPPEQRGALLLSAAPSGQRAAETKDASGRPRGAFSHALVRALREAGPDESADALFLRVRSALLADANGQVPVLAGTSDRRARPLVGSGSSDALQTLVAVIRVRPDARVELDGGAAIGLNTGAELIASGIGDTRRLRVVGVPGVASAVAEVVRGNPGSIRSGELFRLDRWSPPHGIALRITLPPAVDEATLATLRLQVEALQRAALAQGIAWGEHGDATTQPHVLRSSGAGWVLDGPRSSLSLAALDADANARVLSTVGARGRLQVELPPTPELRAALESRSRGAAAIEIVGDADDPHYRLAGLLREGALGYAWLRAGDGRTAAGLPERSDLAAADAGAADALGSSLDALVRIQAWLALAAPPDDGRFPYRLVMRRERDGRRVAGGVLRGGERYRLSLEADRAVPGNDIEPRYVYLFGIDGFGRQSLVFPGPHHGNAENRVPPRAMLGAPAPPVVPIGPIQISAPYGHETLVLLSSATPLADPRVLEGRGVRTRSASALEQFLGWVGSTAATPADAMTPRWGIERFSFVSVPEQGE